MREMSDKMNQCLSYGQDIASRRVGCRCASSVSSMSRLPFPLGNFVMYNDNCVASRTDSVDLFENKEIITTTSENETSNAARLSQNTLPSPSACPVDQCSSSEENDRPTCNCNCIINHRNQNHIQKKKSARRYLYLCISSTMNYCFNKIFRLSIARKQDCSWGIRWIWVYIVLSCLFLMVNAANECAVGIETPGWTVPRGDIIIKYGNPLRIMCVLNETYVNKHFPGKNSSNLIFFRNDKKMEPEYITVINRTTIMLYNELPPPGDNMYYCQLNLSNKDVGVCLNKVVIGYEPKVPSNFTCTSYNWENITCTWETEKNYVQTSHDLMFKFNGGRRGVRRYYPCPAENTKKNSCSWTQYSSPMYRQTYENFTFIMFVHNQFGNISDVHRIDHFAQVIPAKPVNLSVINKTSNSATLYWELPFPLQSFPPGINHKIMYQNQWDYKKDWEVIIIDTDPRLSKRFFNLTGLKYANTVYDVRVYLKSAKAIGENMYSEPSVITFRTLPILPSFPPRTDIGSFEIVENNGNRDIYLYWQMIPQYLENGDNFKYQINYVEENGHKITLEPIETTKAYAKFKGLSFNNYRFKITSMNTVGINKNYTEIVIPSRDEMPHEPIAFTKMAFEGGLYELSWKPPIMHKNIVNYTIFWCDNERDRPYQCTGYLNWTHVSRNTTVYNITVDPDKVYQFAISANTNKGSSGMIWSSCTVIHTKVLGKMKSVWINRIGSDFIEVGWKLDCSDRIGIVEGFKIYYCPIVSPLDTKCKGPKLNVTIKSYPPMISGIVKNLTPYTTYMLEVTTVTKNGESQPSEPLYNTTLEAAPSSSPLNVKAMNVTNTTMFITWQSPEAMNGVLRYYEVYYNGLMKKVEEGKSITKLTSLLAYTDYNISVTACTVACSKKSSMITQRTKIGIPDKIGIPKVRFMNSSQVIVTWSPLQHPAGPIAYYEIENTSGEIYNVTKMEAQLSIPDCKTSQEGLNKFRVRAVNIGPNNEHLIGPWSETGEGNCYNNGLTQAATITIWVVGVVGAVALSLCCICATKRMWLKYQDMQDIEVKLPPGLTPNMLLRKDGGPHTRQPSADSSGCSSGQESVTSSLTTTEFQISSDSGTEVDPVPVSPDKLLDTLSTWESNSASLRQRTVSRGSETTSRSRESYVPVKIGDSNLNEIISLARSVPNLADSTGNTMTPQTWPSTGYISMQSSDLSGNPSPTLRGNSIINTIGAYSVIGIRDMRAPLQTTSEEDGDDGIESAETVHDTLISNKQEMKHNLCIPFMNKKEMPSKINAFNLDKLSTFMESNKSEEDALMSHLTSSDKTMTSKLFFQPNLIDTVHSEPLTLLNSIEQPEKSNISNSFASTSFPNSSNEPFVSSFVSPTLPVSSTDPTSTLTSKNPHVSDERLALPKTSKSLMTHCKENNEETLKMSLVSPSENFSKSSVSSMHEMLQPQENIELSSVKEIQEMEVYEEPAPIARRIIQPILIKHKENSDYVVIADPNIKNTTNQSDEQYSKVTVVPSAMQ
ncbi:hypothetical protein ACFW04_008687 [Cataglyphis niger]